MESNETAASGQGGVSLRGVTKRFGSFTAVDNLDLDLHSGEFFTLLGPSGCGKTTTLRMIAGFETPTEGAVEIDGVDVATMPPHLRPTNTVFQSYALFPHMSVRDNVAFGLKRKKVDKGEIDRRVQAELERVGLWGEANRRPNQLSGGQQQRVALARAVVNLPKVLLLDEPLGALDLKLRKQLQVELKRIQQEIGITFVYVTHDQEEALTMSDRIAVMNHGLVEQVAGPEDVYERPTTTFVAGFIGVSNLMPGTVRSLNGGRAEVELEAGVKVQADANGLGTGERCHAVVRPEKLVVSTANNGATPPDSATHQSVDGVVSSSVYLGTATQLVVELKGDARMTVLVPNASESQRQQLPGGGADVHLAWEPDHIHLVRESGGRTSHSRPRGGRQRTSGGNCVMNQTPQQSNFLRRRWVGVLGALAILGGSLGLSACSDLGAGGRDGPITTAKATGKATGDITISQWPAYIDKKTVPEFEQKTGLNVDYIEDVNDNDEIFSKLQPNLQEGDPSGRSMVVVTDWMAKKMYDLGYLQNFDKNAIPEVNKNLIPSLQHPTFDPERQYSAPWQSGMTGLVVNTKEAPDVHSINDIFNPKYAGRVTVLSEMRDTVPLVMKGEGIDPLKATAEDWHNAIDKLRDAVKSGQIIGVTGNSYINDMARGDVVLAIGWSGDAVQLQADNPDIQFQMPDEGCILWSDNMVIPVGAPNPEAAYSFMNYVYTPKNQAQIEAYDNYTSPVAGVKPIFEKTDPALAKSELIFPSENYQKNCTTQPNPPKLQTHEIEQDFESLRTGG